MLLAAIVLAMSGKKYLRPAVLQGTTPLLAVVLGILAVALG
jgi:putative membrane protein